jgi:hypothetical protein
VDCGVKKSGSTPYPVAGFHPFGNPDADPPCTALAIGGVVEYMGSAVDRCDNGQNHRKKPTNLADIDKL